MNVLRIEPGHEWHGTYTDLPPDLWHYRVPIIDRNDWEFGPIEPKHLRFVMGDTVKTKRNPNWLPPVPIACRVEIWMVLRLSPGGIEMFDCERVLLGPVAHGLHLRGTNVLRLLTGTLTGSPYDAPQTRAWTEAKRKVAFTPGARPA